MKYSATLATPSEVASMVSTLRATPELEVTHDMSAGTYTAFFKAHPSLVIFRAIQKGGAGTPFIVRSARGMFELV